MPEEVKVIIQTADGKKKIEFTEEEFNPTKNLFVLKIKIWN